ncbi:MAG: hypothetical protein M3R62_09775 [Acidobacteriota bacterium]|nr:hypothetical protein [Acidobacteriota bacterium]
MDSGADSGRALLRHAVATLAYRAGRVVRGAPPEFAAFRAAPGSRSAAEILAHIGDLLDWAVTLAGGKHVWSETPPGAWDRDVARIFEGLTRFDEALASAAPLGFPAEKLFQGPVADALTHVGQIGLLRRMAGAPVKGENYFQADIAAGRVGPEQPSPRREFE